MYFFPIEMHHSVTSAYAKMNLKSRFTVVPLQRNQKKKCIKLHPWSTSIQHSRRSIYLQFCNAARTMFLYDSDQKDLVEDKNECLLQRCNGNAMKQKRLKPKGIFDLTFALRTWLITSPSA